MATREANAKLAELLRKADISRSGLARRVVDRAEKYGVERRYTHIDVTRWLGGTQPLGVIPTVIAEILSERLGRPVSVSDIGMPPSDDALMLGAVDYPQSLADAIAAVTAVVHGDRSGAMTAGPDQVDAGAWANVMVQWLLVPEISASPTSRPAHPDVQALAWATDMFSRLDYQFGGGYARSALVEFIRAELSPIMADPRRASSELLGAAASLLRLAGWTAYDTGRHGMASRYLTQALRFAQAAGDRALGGRILAGMSHQAHFLGYHEQAANLARAAQRGAQGHATPTGMALFYAMEARALAGSGDRQGTEAALIAAESWFDRRSPENDPPWLRYFDAAELAAEFAHSYRDLGLADKAIEFGQVAVNDADPLYARSIAFCRCVLAEGHLATGDVEQCLALAEVAAAGAGLLRSERSREYMRDFVRRLAPFRQHHEVAEFTERVTQALRQGTAGAV